MTQIAIWILYMWGPGITSISGVMLWDPSMLEEEYRERRSKRMHVMNDHILQNQRLIFANHPGNWPADNLLARTPRTA